MFGFLALALRQANIARWSTMRCAQRESVLEHSAIVGLLTILVIQYAKENGEQLDESLMLSHALLHDASESITGDTISTTKNANANLLAEFRKIEALATEQMLDMAPGFMRDYLHRAFEPGGMEQKLVKACDIFGAYIKCRLEVAAGNKQEFQDALNKMEESVHQLVETYPEIGRLHADFNAGLGMSIDSLMRM